MIHYYHYMTQKLRHFFQQKNFTEVAAQSQLSLLSGAHHPPAISQFILKGENYPLPQKNILTLEIELLKNPTLAGVFCHTTSYRNQPTASTSREEKIFPLFEFAGYGNINKLKFLLAELLNFLQLHSPTFYMYEEVCKRYNTATLQAEHLQRLQRDYGSVVGIEAFPVQTDPFWNIHQESKQHFQKVEVILQGIKAISAAERSTHVKEMREQFYRLNQGQHAQQLFNAFGEARFTAEFEDYLTLPFLPRYSGSIAVNQLTRALQLTGKLSAEVALEASHTQQETLVQTVKLTTDQS